MKIFEHMRRNNSRELLFFEEQKWSLKAIIAIDSIVLGPANASTKLYNYTDEDEAIADALDIAYFNSLRAALLRRSLGGGSIVLIGEQNVKNEMYFRALGVFLNRWNGNLYMTKAKGISYNDLNHVRKESGFILGLDESHNGLGKIYGSRARGMIWGLRAAAKEVFDNNSLKGLRIVVHGIGDLGSELVKELIAEGADITICDRIYDRIKVIQDKVRDIKIVRPEDVYKTKCDMFLSCASEKIMNASDIKELQCKVLTGSTNQILQSPEDSKLLSDRSILYLPGYIINGGDIIQLTNEISGYGKEKVESELPDIYYNTLDLINEAKKNAKTICSVAVEKSEEYVRNVSAIKMLK